MRQRRESSRRVGRIAATGPASTSKVIRLSRLSGLPVIATNRMKLSPLWPKSSSQQLVLR